MTTAVVRVDTTKLDRLIRTVPQKGDELVKKGATALQGKAVTIVPVDTGALKNSIHTEPRGKWIYWVADGMEYGIYVELGTSRMAAQPFFAPAAEWVFPQYLKSWATLLR